LSIITPTIMAFSIMTLGTTGKGWLIRMHICTAECQIIAFMPSVIMLSVVKLNVILPSKS
jgi:hypothetical protein